LERIGHADCPTAEWTIDWLDGPDGAVVTNAHCDRTIGRSSYLHQA
jgi:hypothetical protein